MLRVRRGLMLYNLVQYYVAHQLTTAWCICIILTFHAILSRLCVFFLSASCNYNITVMVEHSMKVHTFPYCANGTGREYVAGMCCNAVVLCESVLVCGACGQRRWFMCNSVIIQFTYGPKMWVIIKMRSTHARAYVVFDVSLCACAQARTQWLRTRNLCPSMRSNPPLWLIVFCASVNDGLFVGYVSPLAIVLCNCLKAPHTHAYTHIHTHIQISTE